MTPEQRAREFVTAGFRDLGVPSLEPYVTIIAELIDGAEQEARQDARRQVGEAMVEAADSHSAEVADILRGIGQRLAASTNESLVREGLTTIVDEIRAERGALASTEGR